MRLYGKNKVVATFVNAAIVRPSQRAHDIQGDHQAAINTEHIKYWGLENSEFVKEFKSAVRKYADTTCFVCTTLKYRNGLRQTKLTTATVAAITEIAETFLKSKENVNLCHRCYNSNIKGRIPSQTRWNLMEPDVVP